MIWFLPPPSPRIRAIYAIFHNICEKILSKVCICERCKSAKNFNPQIANTQIQIRKSKIAKCHVCGRSTNLTYLSLHICGFAIYGTYLLTAHLCMVNYLYILPETSSQTIDSFFLVYGHNQDLCHQKMFFYVAWLHIVYIFLSTFPLSLFQSVGFQYSPQTFCIILWIKFE